MEYVICTSEISLEIIEKQKSVKRILSWLIPI